MILSETIEIEENDKSCTILDEDKFRIIYIAIVVIMRCISLVHLLV